MCIDELQLGESADNHLAVDILFSVVLNVGNDTYILEVQFAIVLCNDRSIGSSVTSHTTGVEGTQSKLCTRLTNSLSGNHTYSLAHLHHALGSEVAAITLHADAMLALASEH